MSGMFEKVYDDALMLPLDDRIHLVDCLLQSLNAPASDEVAQAWNEEIQRRVEEMDRGDEPSMSAAEVDAMVRKRFCQ
jgi:putative addiction module component (TIGR02574 family)